MPNGEDDANDAEQAKHGKLREFAISTASNILANLIAAAIVYLGAVIFGYLVANPILLAIAIIIVGIAASMGLWTIGAFAKNYTRSAYGKRGVVLTFGLLVVVSLTWSSMFMGTVLALAIFEIVASTIVGLVVTSSIERPRTRSARNSKTEIATLTNAFLASFVVIFWLSQVIV